MEDVRRLSADRLLVLKSRWFERFCRKEGIPDSSLVEAVERALRGQVDADLGGGVIKQRVARSGGGKSGGYRTILLFRKGSVAAFVYGFAKSGRSNLGRDELLMYREAAGEFLRLSGGEWRELIQRGDFVEVSGK